MIVAVFSISTLFGWIFYLDENSAVRKKVGKIIYDISWRLAVLPIFIAVFWPAQRDYDLYFAQQFWIKHDLPQIDTLMHLTHFSRRFLLYSSLSDKPVRHDKKYVGYDIFDEYKCEDNFINEIEEKILTLTYIKPNIIRDSSRIWTLKSINSESFNNIDTLSNYESDSILVAWGLMNKMNNKLIEY